jgi:hypothetical protein
MEHGWRPQTDWEGDPDDWVSAREFNRRGELFARIAKYGNENKEMRESLKKLFEHNRKLYDAGYKKAMTDLRQEKMQAAEEGDTRKLLEIDEQIDNLKEEHSSAIREFDNSVTPTTNATNEEYQVAYESWTQVNPWYGKNADLTKIADNLARTMAMSAQSSGKPIDYKKLLSEVAKEVRVNNPQYFDKERKTSDVDSGGSAPRPRGSSNSGKYSLNQIPEQEREIARTLMASTGMKEEEYVKSYLSANR